MRRPKMILAFVHIEKAAGTTIIHLMRHNFFLRYVDVRPLSGEFEQIFTSKDMQMTMMVNPFLVCVGGHSVKPYSDIKERWPQVRYITLLRNPIRRYISQYVYWRDKRLKNIEFDEFLTIDWVSNLQVKKLAGSENFKLALKNLEQFFLVGCVEQFDEFLVLLRKKLKPQDFYPYYRAHNVSNLKKIREENFSKYYEKIAEKNRLDIELYDHVKSKIMPEQIWSYGSGFAHDVSEFKRQNAGRRPLLAKRRIDYLYRKLYLEPVTGLIRLMNGFPFKGSY